MRGLFRSTQQTTNECFKTAQASHRNAYTCHPGGCFYSKHSVSACIWSCMAPVGAQVLYYIMVPCSIKWLKWGVTKRLHTLKGKVHPEMKTQPLSTRPRADEQLGEVSSSTKLFWSCTAKRLWGIFLKNWSRWGLILKQPQKYIHIICTARPA